MSTYTKRDPDRDGEMGENSVAFTLTKAVDLRSLDTELSEQMGWRKDAGLVAEGNPALASADDPVTVWVMRSDVEASALRSAVADHEVPEEADEDPLVAIREKVAADEPLTAEETQQALRALLLR